MLCGHSMGGGITLQYAVNYPDELKAIITIGSGARLRVHPDYLAEDQEGIRDPGPWNKVAFEEQSDYAPELAQADCGEEGGGRACGGVQRHDCV